MAENKFSTDTSVCRECGATGQDDVFCDSCGAVLRARALGADESATPKPYEEVAEPQAQPLPEPPNQIASILGGGPQDAPAPAPTPAPAPSPAPPAAPVSDRAPTDGWDAVAEWGNVLASEPEASDPAPATPPPSVPGMPGAPGALVPPTRGPYEFTSRRPEAFPPGAAVGPPPTTSPLQAPQSQSGFLVSQSTDTPVNPASAPADAVPNAVAAEPYDDDSTLPPHSQYPGSASPAPYEPTKPMPNPQATPSDLERRARELIVPVADRTPVERIVPVPPGMPEPARPSVRTPQLHEVTGGIPCPWCSTPNPVDRHFCRRCAMSLAAAPGGARRRPWWRRLVDWRRRPIPFAGQRPRLRHGIGRWVRWTIGFAVLVLFFVEVDLHAANGVMDVEDHFATPVEVYANQWYAPDSLAQFPAKNLYDTYNDTWWGSNRVGNSQNVNIEATFDQPIDLLDLIITPGAGTNPDTFNEEWRPETMKVTLVKSDNSTAKTTITFNDTPGPATFKIRGNDVTHIIFTIESAYQGNGPESSTYVAITQIEFYDRNAQKS